MSSSTVSSVPDAQTGRTTQDWATIYIRRGWSIIPIPRGEKGPKQKDWCNLRLTETDAPKLFSEGENIGVLTGVVGSSLLDVDLDALEAVELAPYLLPHTELIHGRPSKPSSHWFYQCDGPVPSSIAYKDEKGECLLELRSAGHQTVIPPSLHPSGEQLQWKNDGEPAALKPVVVQRSVEWLAAATILFRHWPGRGSRHETYLALSGMLLGGGCPRDQVEHFVKILATATQDEEAADRLRAVRSTAEQVSKSEPVRAAAALSKLLGESGKAVTDRVRRWLRLERPEPSQIMLTDAGNAKRFVAQYGDEVRFCRERGGWLVYNGIYWQRDEEFSVERRAKSTAQRIYREAERCDDLQMQKEVTAWARKSQSRTCLRDMLELSKSEPGITLSLSQFDANPWILNCKNGVVDLRNGGLREHRLDEYCSKSIDIEFDAAAQCPLWVSFLDQVFAGRETLKQYVQRAVGYSLTGVTTEHALFLLHGTGANGKTTFVEIVRQVLGRYGLTADPTILLERGRDGISNDIARLAGARFVAAAESGADRKLAVNTVKQLTGGDTITARFLYCESFEFRPQFKLWLATNHLPTIPDSEIAVWRRIKVIPFEVQVPPEQQDKALTEKLQTELPGIFAWAVRGCVMWREGGLAEPEQVSYATASYRSDMDRIGAFIADCCVQHQSATSTFSELYTAYERWSEANGEEVVTMKEFGRYLTQRGFDRKKGAAGRAMRKGIGIAESSKPPF